MQADTVALTPTSPDYPPALVSAGDDRFVRLWSLGDSTLLRRDLLGLFCSTRCPGDVILRVYETARALRDAGIPVIGGFHSPMERECLDLLIRGTQPVVWCPARGLPNLRRLPDPARKALAEGRLLILSPFSGQARRMTAELADARNDLVVRVARRMLFLYAPSGSKTEGLCRKAIADGYESMALTGDHSENLLALGAGPIDLSAVTASREMGW